MLIAALLAVFAIRYLVDQVVLGVVLNVLALGLTGFLYEQVLRPGRRAATTSRRGSRRSGDPGLADIPVIGPALFNQTSSST